MIRITITEPGSAPDFGHEPLPEPRCVVVLDGIGSERAMLPAGVSPAEARDSWQAATSRIAQRQVMRSAVGDTHAWPPPTANRPAVTVVVGTKDRPAQLRRCLAAARDSSRPGDELIVVDNSQHGSARRVAEGAGARWVPETRPGVAFARNTGMATARWPIVVFLDDDGVADRRMLDALIEPFADDVVTAATGAVLGRDPSSAAGQLFDERYPFFRGWSASRFAGSTGTRRSPFDSWRVGTGAVMAWRASAFSEIGGFDPALGEGTPAGGAEDLDLFRRALEAGGTIVYTPRAILWHDHPLTRAALRRKMMHYSITDGAHAAKIAIENGNWGAARMVARQWLRIPRRLAIESGRRLGGRTSLPLSPLAADPVLALVGAARFLRHRGRLRALGEWGTDQAVGY